MRKQVYLLRTLLGITLLFAVSCTSDDRDDPIPEKPTAGDYDTGIFILNEGGFGSSNASVSFLDTKGKVYNSIYTGVNKMLLGDVAQSMEFYKEKAYIVVNNSATIEVVDRSTFAHIATVSTSLINPRYIVFDQSKGYVSNWGDPNDVTDDYVAVLNVNTHQIENKIPVAEGPEKLFVDNGKMYVAHKGGYGYGNSISVIDIATQQVTARIKVADVPSGMFIDKGLLYVLCAGKAPFTQDETLAKLFKINIDTQTVTASLTFPEGKHPSFLDMENGTLYYSMDTAVYSINLTNFQLPKDLIFSPAADGLQILYGFEVNEDKIYLADAKDYVSNGEVFIYTIKGSLQQKFSVQRIPNSFYFNN